VITSGLKPGERVVTSGNFLIDSESQLKNPGGPGAQAAAAAPPSPAGGHREHQHD
jgi:hypothetical protein